MGTPSHFWFLLRVLIQRKINVFNLCCYHIVQFFYLASENTQLAQNQKFSLATRLAVAGWCLAAIVFVNSYSSSSSILFHGSKICPINEHGPRFGRQSRTSNYRQEFYFRVFWINGEYNAQHGIGNVIVFDLNFHRLQHRVLWQSSGTFFALILKTLFCRTTTILEIRCILSVWQFLA